ncbi:MAG: hypothetical protein A2X56_12170 [Nitrospirae bacterium GWC2_57_13]|nr:MAG: hypothetical protein A2X56_12170 [Nitrospirae bacterium GWC2_57_13]HAS53636.1 hypothetical protein [Nitrospiraceae bacterium]
MKFKFKIISIFLLMILMMFAARTNTAFSDTPTQAECVRMHDEIEDDFKKANFCETDTDCKVVQLGGWYIDFGCYKFVNVSINEDELLDKVHRYKADLKCSGKINDCASSGTPVCINKKCSGKKAL